MSELWMRVSPDKYEIPEVIADSIEELADKCGVKVRSIRSTICHYKTEGRRQIYVRVEVPDGSDL